MTGGIDDEAWNGATAASRRRHTACDARRIGPACMLQREFCFVRSGLD
ncbi:hypothetical protein LRP76_10225 [Burkholderia pseudomallei]|uniref:Uncharacterized protein n=1 Tax=Burkholderia mallei (strain NCTC 10229) TaxID=412022 RepID=A2S1W9_BURM9|nr:hypothetical protein [Burkholderia pseudomallei]ABN00285.2 hypothetical protein BMA10229_2145 [Burkholderia mallei NCTC 10229]ABO02154.1 conserved hypothetical protein [Burkholderia mallei NCTC 10247]EBA48034.1 hypothetical protein BURPS305_3348 [Burkholderia pseudomallei 305]EDK55608.1 hypothetical protein BMAFMH_E0708 [Burkholderia mallei FMH]EDK61534.1 hypothetical protein BMAJHU_I0628 [Burkholderia mallei JHU]EDK86149.1 conserved hypothetical protein [Burkholderia mallei 2002721280]ED